MHHGAELVEFETASTEAAAQLGEDDGAGRGEADGDGDDGHEGEGDDKGDQGEEKVGDALNGEAKVVVRSASEGKQLSRAKTFEGDAAVDVRKESDIEAGANALVGAEQEEVFNRRELGGIHGDDELVDDMAFEQRREFGPGVHGVRAVESDLAGRVGEESEQREVMGGRAADALSDGEGPGRVTSDENLTRLGEVGGKDRRRGTETEAEQQQEEQSEAEEEAQERPAQVHAEEKLKDDGCDADPEALADGPGEDLRKRKAGEAVIDAQPESDHDKGQGDDQEEGVFGAGLQKEEARERKEGTDEVGALKGSPDEKQVGEGK